MFGSCSVLYVNSFTMAIRRISDIGNLTSSVPNPSLDKCLIEVSYPRGDPDVVDGNV